ncbi:transposase [Desulforamulus ferrireducens]|uniref:Transposase n=1 Tax=Desulforamulus ferrireducens TaxID=1833852 RepID=A0A1S6IUI3_9FIRM|nr:transposase [Desulforamulus ferrireducens]AQS58448.1 transposase [Desulforamulus ferrireducens]AQS59673.1 transposase [Desulforamulus ferrireducens]
MADNWIARGYAKAFVLDTLEISESTYYHRKKKGQVPQNPRTNQGGRPIPGYSWTKDQRRVSDLEIKEWLLELISGDESVYGYRKLTTCLRRKHQLAINKKKVYRLCKELDILSPQRRVSISHPRRIAINRKVSAPNQLWEIDIKYGYIQGEDRFFYFMGILDIYDRILIDYHIGLSCEGKHAAQLIQRALWKRKLLDKEQRPVIRTDNGPQFISHVFEDACETYKIEHERIPPKTPNKNAHIESFHSILERECFSRHEFRSYQEAYKKVREFMEFYNQSRIHGSLYDLSPFEFNQQMTAGEIKPFVVKV